MHAVKEDLPCKFCSSIFKDKTHLRNHYWAMHIKVKPYKCKHCSFQGTQPNRVYAHCRSAHKFTGSKADVQMVDSEFERIHTFETQYGLNRQEYKNNSKEYRCFICNKDLVKNQSLMHHEFVHLNLSPYECTKCDKIFKKKEHLLKHFDSNHNEKVFASDINANPDAMALYQRVKKIHPKLVQLYLAYKDTNPTVIDMGNGSKTVNTISCKKCVEGSCANFAAFLDHFHSAHGYEFSNAVEAVHSLDDDSGNNLDESVVVGTKVNCKCCGVETVTEEALYKHVAEVHRFTPEMYQRYSFSTTGHHFDAGE